ncbi:Domain of Uncharacterised Function with PDB structure [Leminorella richardii]|uniref:Domain of Uncharacterized Function with PDB structure n=1 Tax=Leminorella richardii TaxID=158841 RepID=A0A2X4U8M5_9GAMM|nr:DUF3861 domain-containing protein [Leminorella richardii]SQI36177.1 Domain of Uncharacterised Function with PDB structure [Leminorella richardii]
MPSHKYRVTLEPLNDSGESVESPVTFEVENHDDIIKIVNMLKTREDIGFDEQTTLEFTVGLKLFSEVMMKHRKHWLFEPLKDSFKSFMMGLKKGIRE